MKDDDLMELDRLMLSNGLRKSGLALLMCVHPNTVTQWFKDGAPVSVMKYLRLRIKIKKLTGDLYEEFVRYDV